ncbi:MAG TPA: hypothetical protein VGS19_17095 [Streptosporangiaceae bacterium]|nr:hypothetical protein [Streptosporangiaceae bacterium]
MRSPVWLHQARRPTAAGLAALALTAAVVFVVTPATSSASSTLTLRYPVNGNTLINAANATLTLGPGTLTSKINLSNGQIASKLALPPATGSFNELGLIPVTATTQFIQDGPTTGTVNINTGAVTATSYTTLRITSLSVAGVPVSVGTTCQSSTPATILVVSQPGFSVVNGGNLSGIYTIPPFANCGLVTTVLNLTIAGPNNAITLTLGKGHSVG